MPLRHLRKTGSHSGLGFPVISIRGGRSNNLASQPTMVSTISVSAEVKFRRRRIYGPPSTLKNSLKIVALLIAQAAMKGQDIGFFIFLILKIDFLDLLQCGK